jgi:hypothetical protein
MRRAARVTPAHLTRNAVISIRPSTPHQVLTHHARLHRPYARRQRALPLGWRTDALDVMDTDLGLTAVDAAHRAGVNARVARGTLGHVGLLRCRDVTRLSRPLTAWYPRRDLGGFTGGVLADRHGVYAPATQNGRL